MSGSALVLRGDALRLPLANESVDLVVCSPPYFSLRSYRDGGEHFAGQLGSEPTPQEFLESLWEVMKELWRVLKPTGSCFVNLGDKRSGSGGHNNSGVGKGADNWRKSGLNGGKGPGKKMVEAFDSQVFASPPATRRNAPDRYNQAAFGRAKSKMLLPHRFAEGCMDGLASPCRCPEKGGYRCPPGMHRSSGTCVLHGRCRTAWIMRQDVVWQKLNGLPESVTDRCRDSHEYLFHFTKAGRYFAAVDEVREPQTGPTFTGRAGVNVDGTEHRSSNDGLNHRRVAMADREYNPLGKLPGSVWALPSEPLIISDEVKAHYGLPDHFAAFPTELVRRVILGWSPSGVCTVCGEGRRPVVAKTLSINRAANSTRSGAHDAKRDDAGASWGLGTAPTGATEATITGYACRCGDPAPPTRPAVVLDPFLGSGTTTMVARALGRIGVGTDLSADYTRLAHWRTFKSGGGAKAINRTNREAQEAML